MDREAWWATVRGVTKSWTRLSDSHTHTHTQRQLEGFWDLLSSQWRTSWRRKDVCGCSLPAPKKTWKASQKCVKDMLCYLPWNLTAVFFSCLPTTFNNGFGIPFLYRAVQTYYILKNVSLSMLSSGTPYKIWVAYFVNPFIQEKTKGFYEFFMCGYIYVCICMNM